MSQLLSIFEGVKFDNSIIKREYHTYLPYASNTFKLNDEIRIPIHASDLYLDIANSYIYLEGKIAGDLKKSKLTNNAFAFMFREARYELNGVLLDECKDVGMTVLLKNLATMKAGEEKMLSMMGWRTVGDLFTIDPVTGTFSAAIPLNKIFGLMEDYRKLFIMSKHELILFRAKSDFDCFKGTDELKITLNKVEWHAAHVLLSDEIKLKMLAAIDRGKILNVPFRRWDLYEFPELRSNRKETWTIKTFSNLERPRYVIVGFQTNKRENKDASSASLDYCSITNITLYVNDAAYPYDRMDLDFDMGLIGEAYRMYVDLNTNYNNLDTPQPALTFEDFKMNPIFCIDCSKQNDSIKLSTCDVKLDIETKQNFPEKTKCFALIIHDSLFNYNPLTGEVRKLIN